MSIGSKCTCHKRIGLCAGDDCPNQNPPTMNNNTPDPLQEYTGYCSEDCMTNGICDTSCLKKQQQAQTYQIIQAEAEELYQNIFATGWTKSQAMAEIIEHLRKYRGTLEKLGERVREAEKQNRDLEQKALEQATELAGVDARIEKMFTPDQVRRMLSEAFNNGSRQQDKIGGDIFELNKEGTINYLMSKHGKTQ